jgi:hypothetical protein
MTQEAFNSLWKLQEIPACEVGMVLLKRWADADPSNVEYLPEIAWWEPPATHTGSHEWRAYEWHRAKCPDCNEL